jgi:hypothetical protein
MQYAFKPTEGQNGPCDLISLNDDFKRGALSKLGSIIPSPFGLRVRLNHLHGVDLKLGFDEYQGSIYPFDDRDGDLDVPIDTLLTTSQAEVLGKYSSGNGLTDLQFVLDLTEWRPLSPLVRHQALITVPTVDQK